MIDDWKKCSIRKYYEICDVIDSDADVFDKMTQLVTICHGSDATQMSIIELNKAIKDLEFIKNPLSINKTFHDSKITIDNELYTISTDVFSWNVAQYVDFQALYNSDYKDTYGKLLAVFIIPKGHTYNDGYSIDEVAAKIYDTLSIKIANDILFFFLQRLRHSIRILVGFLSRRMKKIDNQMATEMIKTMEDILTLMDGSAA